LRLILGEQWVVAAAYLHVERGERKQIMKFTDIKLSLACGVCVLCISSKIERIVICRVGEDVSEK